MLKCECCGFKTFSFIIFYIFIVLRFMPTCLLKLKSRELLECPLNIFLCLVYNINSILTRFWGSIAWCWMLCHIFLILHIDTHSLLKEYTLFQKILVKDITIHTNVFIKIITEVIEEWKLIPRSLFFIFRTCVHIWNQFYCINVSVMYKKIRS